MCQQTTSPCSTCQKEVTRYNYCPTTNLHPICLTKTYTFPLLSQNPCTAITHSVSTTPDTECTSCRTSPPKVSIGEAASPEPTSAWQCLTAENRVFAPYQTVQMHLLSRKSDEERRLDRLWNRYWAEEPERKRQERIRERQAFLDAVQKTKEEGRAKREQREKEWREKRERRRERRRERKLREGEGAAAAEMNDGVGREDEGHIVAAVSDVDVTQLNDKDAKVHVEAVDVVETATPSGVEIRVQDQAATAGEDKEPTQTVGPPLESSHSHGVREETVTTITLPIFSAMDLWGKGARGSATFTSGMFSITDPPRPAASLLFGPHPLHWRDGAINARQPSHLGASPSPSPSALDHPYHPSAPQPHPPRPFRAELTILTIPTSSHHHSTNHISNPPSATPSPPSSPTSLFHDFDGAYIVEDSAYTGASTVSLPTAAPAVLGPRRKVHSSASSLCLVLNPPVIIRTTQPLGGSPIPSISRLQTQAPLRTAFTEEFDTAGGVERGDGGPERRRWREGGRRRRAWKRAVKGWFQGLVLWVVGVPYF